MATQTWVHDGLARLETEVARAADAEDDAWRAYRAASPDDGPARMVDYVRASTRRSTLNEAGLIVTLGRGETDDVPATL